jgi:hypothetical protein
VVGVLPSAEWNSLNFSFVVFALSKRKNDKQKKLKYGDA